MPPPPVNVQSSTETPFRELLSSPLPHYPELESIPSSPVKQVDSEEEADEYTKNFYRMIPEMHNLVRMLNSKGKKRNIDMGKVLCRGGNSSLLGRDVYVAQKQKLLSKEINSGCGFGAPPSKPYKAFENGVSFEDSRRQCEKDLEEVLGRRKTQAQIMSELTSITELTLDVPMVAKAGQYQRKLFVVHLEKYSKHLVKNKAFEVRVSPIRGDPDLYVSIAEPPTEKEYMWRSLQEGQDTILIHPNDPNYIFGSYYICVMCTSSECEFELLTFVSKPVLHDDDEVYVKAQRVMYLSIKSCIKGSENRRRLCAGGRGIQQIPPDTPAYKQPKERPEKHRQRRGFREASGTEFIGQKSKQHGKDGDKVGSMRRPMSEGSPRFERMQSTDSMLSHHGGSAPQRSGQRRGQRGRSGGRGGMEDSRRTRRNSDVESLGENRGAAQLARRRPDEAVSPSKHGVGTQGKSPRKGRRSEASQSPALGATKHRGSSKSKRAERSRSPSGRGRIANDSPFSPLIKGRVERSVPSQMRSKSTDPHLGNPNHKGGGGFALFPPIIGSGVGGEEQARSRSQMATKASFMSEK